MRPFLGIHPSPGPFGFADVVTRSSRPGHRFAALPLVLITVIAAACGQADTNVATGGQSNPSLTGATTAPPATSSSRTPPTTIVRHLDMVGRAVPLEVSEASAIDISDKGTLVVASEDGTATVFVDGPGTEGERIRLTDDASDGAIYDVAVIDSPRAFFLVGRERSVRGVTWDGTAWTPQPAFERQLGVLRSVVASPDGTWVASAGDEGLVIRWDVRTGAALGDPVDVGGAVADLALSPDGETIAALLADGRVALIDQSIDATVDAPSIVSGASGRSIAFQDDRTLIGSGGTTVWSLDTSSGTPSFASGPELSDSIDAVDAWSRRGGPARLVAAAGIDRGSPAVVVWDPAAPDHAVSIGGLGSQPTAIAVSPDGAYVVFSDFRQAYAQSLTNT